jgi:hypothetical protein
VACAITITSVAGVGSPPTSVHVAGTVTPGACASVSVTLQCNAPATATLVVPVDPLGNWSADFTALGSLSCICGKEYVVRAECSGASECTPAVAKGPLDCRSSGCPTAAVSATQLGCTPDGRRTVRLDATISGVPTIVTQWDFGDGSLGTANASLAYSVQHDYVTPGPYTATLNVVLPRHAGPVHGDAERRAADRVPARRDHDGGPARPLRGDVPRRRACRQRVRLRWRGRSVCHGDVHGDAGAAD